MFVDTKEQHDIINAMSNSLALSEAKLESVVEAMAQWRLMLGVPKDGSSSQELAIAARFVHSQFTDITLEELNLACLNFTLQNYDAKIEYYGTLSPLFIGQVIKAYKDYRKSELKKAQDKKNKYEDQKLLESSSAKPSPEEECERTKRIIALFYKEWKEKGEIVDIPNVCYNEFNKHKDKYKFLFDEERVKKAQEWAAHKYAQDINKDSLMYKYERQDMRKSRYAKTWCVMDYFSRFKDVNEILNKITPEMF